MNADLLFEIVAAYREIPIEQDTMLFGVGSSYYIGRPALASEMTELILLPISCFSHVGCLMS